MSPESCQSCRVQGQGNAACSDCRRERLGLDQFDGDRLRAFQTLTAYWQQMGYEKFSETDDHAIYYINPTVKQPAREKILGTDYERLG